MNLSEKNTRKRLAPECARRMIAILIAKQEWIKRPEIMKLTGWKDSRLCRLGCECSHGRIIFGNKGYKAIRFATMQEIGECLGNITAIIKTMQRRYDQISRRYHHHDIK